MCSNPNPSSSRAGELYAMDVATLSAAFRKRELSPVEVVCSALERAEEIAHLNAFTFLDFDRAMRAAEASERRWCKGEPLSLIDGVPTTVKDILHVEGWSVRYGSRVTDPAPFESDAPAVGRLRQAGAVFIGQTTTPEYGWKAVTDSPAFGVTRNPWNPELTPGGSSGGAAVAAVCGAGVLHVGTDGGGSVRIPASFTGIVGHKPSYGRVAFAPPSSFGTVAHIGPMTRTVADATVMLQIMSGKDLRDWTQPPMPFPDLDVFEYGWKGKRIGYWRTPCVGNVDVEVLNAVDSVIADLRKAGAQVEELRLPDQDDLLEIYTRHWCVGAANRLSTIDVGRIFELDPGFVAAAQVGQEYSGVQRMSAEIGRGRFGSAMDALLCEYDLIVSPTVPILPFEAGGNSPDGDERSWVEWSSFSFPINLSQQPACSLPCGFSHRGLPIGLQMIGARGDDRSVLSAAQTYEAMYRDRFIQPGGRWPVGH